MVAENPWSRALHCQYHMLQRNETYIIIFHRHCLDVGCIESLTLNNLLAIRWNVSGLKGRLSTMNNAKIVDESLFEIVQVLLKWRFG